MAGDSVEDYGGLHPHCQTCVKTRCKVQVIENESCPLVFCSNNCGATFHECKGRDHMTVCLANIVACINQTNGCPVMLPRHGMAAHLPVCPASVVHCTMEWNRWPVYSKERRARVPFSQSNIHARCGQLDVALALRDQRVLNHAMKMPRRTRRALRNKLTQRFPAVPLSTKHSGFEPDPACSPSDTTSEDDDGDAPWMQSQNPPGLQRSVCGELFKATRNATESLSAALSVAIQEPQGGSTGEDHEGCQGDSIDNLGDHHGNNIIKDDTDIDNHEYLGIDDNACSQKLSNCDQKEESQACYHGDVVTSHSNQESPRGNTGDGSQPENPSLCDVEPVKQPSSLSLNEPLEIVCDILISPRSPVSPGPGYFIEPPHGGPRSQDSPCSQGVCPEGEPGEVGEALEGRRASLGPPVPPTSLTLQQILGLDLNMEYITRYQAKPRSMYTFLCAQSFRRDEYAWHFKNVHCDIHGCLNGWMEQRCPLASYGCTYSFQNIKPMNPNGNIIYSPLVESFGVQPTVSPHLISPCHETTGSPDWSTTTTGHRQKEPTPEIFTSKDYDSEVKVNGNLHRTIQRDASVSPPRDADILSSLPLEVLLYITQFLDSFSLSNLALTSRYLRDSCSSLLEERGMVIQEWERQLRGGRSHWFLAYKRWQFSNAFTPVTRWGFVDHPHISDHLRVCPFNRPAEPPTQPWKLLISDSDSQGESLCRYRILQQMYPEFKSPLQQEAEGVNNGD